MQPENAIKEEISKRFIELIAAFEGYKTNSPGPDYGVDLNLSEVDYRIENDKKRYFDTGRNIDIQVKTTTVKSLAVKEEMIQFDLKSKNYNDLIARLDSKTPLLLFLLVLPEDSNTWLEISSEELIARKCVYWYRPDKANLSNNTSSVRIEIPKENLVKIGCLNSLLEGFS